MFSKNEKICIRQLESLLILDLYSRGVLFLPRLAVEAANQDGWICLIGATILAAFYGFIITRLVRRFPNDTFVEFSAKILSKPVGMVLSLLFFVKLIIFAAFELRIFGEVVKQILLPQTPIEVIIASMLLIASYLVRKGFEARARLGEILFFIVFIPLISVLIFVLPDADFGNLQPFLTTSFTHFLKSSYDLSLTYIAIELLLLVGPFINDYRKLEKASVISIFFVGILNVISAIIVLAVFGVVQTKRQLLPFMVLMGIVEIPGAFIERQEILMIIFWILSDFSFINASLYFSSLIIKRVSKIEDQGFLVLPLVPIVYLISLFPDNIVQTTDWILVLRSFRILFMFFIPLVLLLVARLRKLGETVEK
ncbi:MAG: GerAB/ArcD/ProY family transporter [Epulopiscium sp.]|mgnify:FL=1|nr:GerAB/ArcD/ProY family transporter [Candidatus Epulonipiscium sp.]